MAVRIVIAGCGFGGMAAALGLKRRLGQSARIIAIDKTGRFDYHATLPELVSGKVTEDEITIGYQALFSQHGIEFTESEISGIDWRKKRVLLPGRAVRYDYLVLAVGSQTDFYGVPGARENAFEFKSDSDALAIRSHVGKMFKSCKISGKTAGDTCIVVVGGGLTGVELATDLKDLLDKVCAQCGIPGNEREIVLVGRSKHLSPGFSEEVGKFCEEYFKKQGITLLLGNPVARVGKGCVVLQDGRKIKAKTIVWCAGIRPSRLAEELGGKNYNDRCGLVLNKYLQWIASPSIFAVGDCGYCSAMEVQPTLTAMRAIEQADYVVHNIACEIQGRPNRKMQYSPRVFPALISLGRGMGVMSYQGIWAAGRHISWFKKITHHIHLARFRHDWEFLEYFDELFVSLMELIYIVSVRGK